MKALIPITRRWRAGCRIHNIAHAQASRCTTPCRPVCHPSALLNLLLHGLSVRARCVSSSAVRLPCKTRRIVQCLSHAETGTGERIDTTRRPVLQIHRSQPSTLDTASLPTSMHCWHCPAGSKAQRPCPLPAPQRDPQCRNAAQAIAGRVYGHSAHHPAAQNSSNTCKVQANHASSGSSSAAVLMLRAQKNAGTASAGSRPQVGSRDRAH